MGILNYDTKKAPKSLWAKRFFAFIIDFTIVILLIFIIYKICGEPDFYAVKSAMDAFSASGSTDAALQREVIASFGRCYTFSLVIWFFYEVITQILFQGATIGKLVMHFRIVSINPDRNKAQHILLLTARSVLKVVALYLFQGFPFIICQLTIFTNAECRSGFDMAVKTKVVQISKRKD